MKFTAAAAECAAVGMNSPAVNFGTIETRFYENYQ